MPSETDLYFPVSDARYEAKFIPTCHADADSVAVGPSGGCGRRVRPTRVSSTKKSQRFSPQAPPRADEVRRLLTQPAAFGRQTGRPFRAILKVDESGA